MSVIRIKRGTKILEMDRQAFYSIINGINKNVHGEAQSIYEDHRLGLLNSNGSQQTPYLWSQDREQLSLLNAIEEEQIRDRFVKLKRLAAKLQRHDKKIVAWLANHFGFESLDNSQDRQKLNQKLSAERRKAAKNGTGLLSWVKEPEYQRLVRKSFEIVNSIQEIVSEIDEKIEATMD